MNGGGIFGLFKDNNKYITFTQNGDLQYCNKNGKYPGLTSSNNSAVFLYDTTTEEVILNEDYSYILINKDPKLSRCNMRNKGYIKIYYQDDKIYQLSLTSPDKKHDFKDILEIILYAPNLIVYLNNNTVCKKIKTLQQLNEEIQKKNQKSNLTINNPMDFNKVEATDIERKKILLTKLNQVSLSNITLNKSKLDEVYGFLIDDEHPEVFVPTQAGGNLSNNNINYHSKYQKYKLKYLNLKSQKN